MFMGNYSALVLYGKWKRATAKKYFDITQPFTKISLSYFGIFVIFQQKSQMTFTNVIHKTRKLFEYCKIFEKCHRSETDAIKGPKRSLEEPLMTKKRKAKNKHRWGTNNH